MRVNVNVAIRAVFWLLCLLLPVAMIPLLLALQAMNDARAATAWVQTPAVVVASGASSTCTKGCVHLASIRYRYTFNRSEYLSDRIFFGDQGLSSRADAQAMASDYPPGRSFEVFVDPENPAQAAMFVGKVGERTWISAVAVIAVYLFAWAAFFVMRYALRDAHDLQRP